MQIIDEIVGWLSSQWRERIAPAIAIAGAGASVLGLAVLLTSDPGQFLTGLGLVVSGIGVFGLLRKTL